jgi:hypothetical protein
LRRHNQSSISFQQLQQGELAFRAGRPSWRRRQSCCTNNCKYVVPYLYESHDQETGHTTMQVYFRKLELFVNLLGYGVLAGVSLEVFFNSSWDSMPKSSLVFYELLVRLGNKFICNSSNNTTSRLQKLALWNRSPRVTKALGSHSKQVSLKRQSYCS